MVIALEKNIKFFLLLVLTLEKNKRKKRLLVLVLELKKAASNQLWWSLNDKLILCFKIKLFVIFIYVSKS